MLCSVYEIPKIEVLQIYNQVVSRQMAAGNGRCSQGFCLIQDGILVGGVVLYRKEGQMALKS